MLISIAFAFLQAAGASEFPKWSTIFFIVGVALWIIGWLYGVFRTPWTWERGLSFGLMLIGIGLRVIFAL